jgi:hypothetical protein
MSGPTTFCHKSGAVLPQTRLHATCRRANLGYDFLATDWKGDFRDTRGGGIGWRGLRQLPRILFARMLILAGTPPRVWAFPLYA